MDPLEAQLLVGMDELPSLQTRADLVSDCVPSLGSFSTASKVVAKQNANKSAARQANVKAVDDDELSEPELLDNPWNEDEGVETGGSDGE
eukprot:9668929-Heterocapsa_arctica.AAC.1